MLSQATITRRRWIVGISSLTITLMLGLGFGHTGSHMVQNILVPGLGLHERSVALAIGVFVVMIAAIVAWIRWGVDWLPLAVLLVSTAASGIPLSGGGHHHGMLPEIVPVYAAHEFPIVVAVVAGLLWLKSVMRSIPVLRRLVTRPVTKAPGSIAELPAVEASQGAIIGWLAKQPQACLVAAAQSEKVLRRATWISRIARLRFGADVFAVDHGLARAAMSVNQLLTDQQRQQLLQDAEAAAGGVPCSEPGWLRLLDGTLTAIALHEAGDESAGERWRTMLNERFPLKRGHRPAMCWVPLGMPLGQGTLWEQALAMGLARQYGWCGDEDWFAIRAGLLGAAARGVQVIEDERAIAAGRLWLNWIDDEQATRILKRPTVKYDPIAKAIEAYGELIHKPTETTLTE